MAIDDQEFTPKGEFKILMDIFKEFKTDVKQSFETLGNNVEMSIKEMKVLINNVVKTKDNCLKIFVKKESMDFEVRKIIREEREERLNSSNTKATLTNTIFNVAYKLIVVGAIVYMVLQNTGVL